MRVLTVLDRPQTARFTLCAADLLAMALHADDLRVLHPRPERDPRFLSPDEGIPTPAEQAQFAAIVAEVSDALRAIMAEWRAGPHPVATQSPIPVHRNWVDLGGDVRRIVSQEAARADVVVHGRAQAQDTDFVKDAFACILYEARTPLLIAPPHPIDTLGRLPAIAWHPSPALDRAILSAMPILERAERVTFIVGTANGGDAGLPPAAEMLQRAGVTVAVERFEIGKDGPGPAIRAHARDIGCDLLVMGAGAHPRFLEWLWGDTTDDMLTHAALPILTRH